MEKKEIKIGLGTFILLIVILIVAIGGCVYLFLNKDKSEGNIAINEVESKEVIEQNTENNVNTSNTTNTSSSTNTTVKTKQEDKDIVSGTRLQSLLGPDDAWFCIKEGKKDGDDYIITAAMLNDERRIVTEEEYEDILKGENFEFRGLKWSLVASPSYDRIITIESGEKRLNIMQDDDGTYFIQNIAGVATTGLRDLSNNTFKFKVSEDVNIYQFFAEFEYNEDGDLKVLDIEGNEMTKKPDTTVNELLQMAKRNSGTYEECRAFVKDGVVEAIQILNK